MIDISKTENEAALSITGEISSPLAPDAFPIAGLKGSPRVTVDINGAITDAMAALQLANAFTRVGVALATIRSARGMAILPAIAADAVVIADGGDIEFSCLPSDPDNTSRRALLSKLAARLGETEDVIVSWFARKRTFKEADATALFTRANGFGAKALLTRDGKDVDPAKVYARYNAPRGVKTA